MRSRFFPSRLGLVAVSALLALSVLATGADAGKDRGRQHRKHRGNGKHVRTEVRWRESRPVVVARPAPRVHAVPVYAACRPRYVSHRSAQVVVVRPAPYVRIGARIGAVDIAAVLGGGRHHVAYEYGCNFCEAHYASFDAYDDHVHACSHRPRNVRIVARAWEDGERWEDRGCDEGYDDGGYDERYDDRGYDEGYDDRYDG